MALQGQTRTVYPAVAGQQPSANEISIYDQFNSTADPTTTNDITQGFNVGSVWFNATAGALRWWECHDNTLGAAKWVFSGADYVNGGTTPSNEGTQFGSGTAVANAEGNVSRQVSSAGINPAFIGSDVVVAVYVIPANSLDGAAGTNRMLMGQAWGIFSADATSKRVKMIFSPNAQTAGNTVSGGTIMADTLATTSNSGGWYVSGNIIKYGVANSNTQLITSNGAIAGSAHSGMSPPSLTTGLESTSLYICVTANATASTTSITFNLMTVDAMN